MSGSVWLDAELRLLGVGLRKVLADGQGAAELSLGLLSLVIDVLEVLSEEDGSIDDQGVSSLRVARIVGGEPFRRIQPPASGAAARRPADQFASEARSRRAGFC